MDSQLDENVAHGLPELALLQHLEVLDLFGVFGTSDDAMESLSSCDRLRAISLLDCDKITDRGVMALSRLSTLEVLILGDFLNVTNLGIRALSNNLPRLRALSLSHACKFSGEGIETLKDHPSLEELRLDGCENVSGRHLSSLLEMPKLKQLTLVDIPCAEKLFSECEERGVKVTIVRLKG